MAGFLCNFFNFLFTALVWAILIRVLLSWIPNLDPYNPLVRLLRQITDPILEPARRIIPPLGGLDISPIVVLLLIQFLIQPLVLRFVCTL
jgi:YggT family protein